jgi:hypothetical protein
MLTPDEELRVASCIDVCNANLKGIFDDGLKVGTSLWLAEKLREINEELGDTIAELKIYKCQHLNTTKTKDLQDKPIRVCDDCDSIIEEIVCNCLGISHVKTCPKWVLPF